MSVRGLKNTKQSRRGQSDRGEQKELAGHRSRNSGPRQYRQQHVGPVRWRTDPPVHPTQNGSDTDTCGDQQAHQRRGRQRERRQIDGGGAAILSPDVLE